MRAPLIARGLLLILATGVCFSHGFVATVMMALLVAIWRKWVRGLDDDPDKPQSA